MLALLLPSARSCRLATLVFLHVFFLGFMFSSVAVAESSAMPASAGPYEVSQQERLLADIFPDTRPDVLSGVSAGFSGLPEHHGWAGEHGLIWTLESGPELVNKRFGLRLGGSGTWYAPSQQFGLRLDAAVVQNELRPELSKLLLSTGTKLAEDMQLGFSAGWLQRYAWSNLPGVGERGTGLNQYTMGAELKRQFQPQGEGLAPGVSVSFSGLYFQGDSKKFWRLFHFYSNFNDIPNPPYTEEKAYPVYNSYYNYGLSGGYQYESLVGMELFWPTLTLDLRAGLRHKDYDSLLGHASKDSNAPKAVARLTFPDILSGELSVYYSWDPDLQVVGGDVRRAINQNLSLVARAETAQSRSLPDDSRYFFGIEYSFGAQSKLPLAAKSTSSTCNINNELQTTEQHSYAYNDWLKPVHGSNVEHLMVVRRVYSKSEPIRQWKIKPPEPDPIPPPQKQEVNNKKDDDDKEHRRHRCEEQLYILYKDTKEYNSLSLRSFREAYCAKDYNANKPSCARDDWKWWYYLLSLPKPPWRAGSGTAFYEAYCCVDDSQPPLKLPDYCRDLDVFAEEYDSSITFWGN